MNVEEFRMYFLNKNGVSEGFPFGPDTLVFKVGEKIFALTSLNSVEFKVNLKCNPDYAEELREKHPEIIPGYHMNKKHWNTVCFQGNLENDFLKELIDHSYDLVLKSLPKSVREKINTY